jgi:hypothetical protein
MNYLRYSLRQLFLLALPVAVGRLLLEVLSPWPAFGAAAALGALTSSLGAVLLATTSVNQITWRNYLGGYLMPWGYQLGRGKLPRIAVISAVVWTALAASTILAASAPTTATLPTGALPTATPGPVIIPSTPWLLVLAWIVDGGALLYVLSTLSKHFAGSSSGGRSLRKVSACLCLLLTASILLHLGGHSHWATVVAGGPPLVVGGGYGVWVLVILTIGRHARWN